MSNNASNPINLNSLPLRNGIRMLNDAVVEYKKWKSDEVDVMWFCSLVLVRQGRCAEPYANNAE